MVIRVVFTHFQCKLILKFRFKLKLNLIGFKLLIEFAQKKPICYESNANILPIYHIIKDKP